MSSHRFAISVLACALLSSTSMHAQTTSAAGPLALQGTVKSSQEGAMEGVLVSAKKTGSTITTTVVTDEKGHYAFPASRLEPGHYDIAIRAVGFKLSGATSADVSANKAATADLALTKTLQEQPMAHIDFAWALTSAKLSRPRIEVEVVRRRRPGDRGSNDENERRG